MADLIERETVTDVGAIRSPNSRLALSEIADRYVWSLQPDHRGRLNAFTHAIFAAAPQSGEVLKMDSLRLLYLWPHKAWLLSSRARLPRAVDDFSAIMTDISHGFCEFRLGGEQALDFLGSYSSASLTEYGGSAKRSLRCLLGQYPVVLWWDDSANVRLLVERSYARSFYDYLASLMARWSQ